MSSPILQISIIFLLILSSTICSLPNNVTFDCVSRERRALLKFKTSLSDPSDRLSSWNMTNTNCCAWQGVECDKVTGHVIGLHLQNGFTVVWNVTYPNYGSMLQGEKVDSSLLELKYLSYLDLSWNDFQGSPIPAFLGSMKQLRYLYLSGANFIGVVPHQLGNLSSLHALDLTCFDGELRVDDLRWASNLLSLEYLDMTHVNLSTTKDLIKVLNMLPSVVELHLSHSRLDNTNLAHVCANSTLLPKAQYLDLSYNSLEGKLPCFLQNMTSLSYLDLSYNHYNSSDLHFLTSMNNLVHLNLSGNSLRHKADWISDLLRGNCHLKSLSLRDNQFYGDISGVFKNLTACSSHNLESLRLSLNPFYGRFPKELVNLRALRVLGLGNNQLSGEIPISLGQLSNLETISIRKNSFNGTLSEAHFAKLSKLKALDVGDNMLKFNVGYDWVPPFQLEDLQMSSTGVGGQLPQWVQTQKALNTLVLSNCSIRGTLPKWLRSMNLTVLYLSQNHIEGSFPELPSTIQRLHLSDNVINGSIPESLCQMKDLYRLDLSKNQLSGNLPNCWGNLGSLYVARLSSNKLTGFIPNSIGGAYNLGWLHLNNNSLTGQLPSTLKNCTWLRGVDVGDNKLSGTLPQWIGNHLFHLQVLRVRNNEFYDAIPSAYCQLPKLQIMDLADNKLTGNIPHCFANLSGMIENPSANSARLKGTTMSEVMKGSMLEYTTTLQYLVNLDLSNNRLAGEIPSELTNLTALNGLNLSHNHLRGKIPARMGDMKSLESLDLSNNNLFGPIPNSLSEVTSLSHLNLSSNDLSGQIPIGRQLQTFDYAYEGNPGLCGKPLPKNCQTNEMPSKDDKNDGEDDDVGGIRDKLYLAAFIFSGFATGLWGYFGVLIFKRSWRLALFRYMDTVINKVLGRR